MSQRPSQQNKGIAAYIHKSGSSGFSPVVRQVVFLQNSLPLPNSSLMIVTIDSAQVQHYPVLQKPMSINLAAPTRPPTISMYLILVTSSITSSAAARS